MIVGLVALSAGVAGYVWLGRGTAVPLGILRLDPPAMERPIELPPLWERLGSLSVTQQLTGPGSPNQTFERWNVGGTDLGFTFFHE
jgi:hypothetical protein